MHTGFKSILAAVAIAAVAATGMARADIVGENVVYEVNGKPFEGYAVQNTGFGDSQPAVLLVHDWDGLDDYEKQRATMLAAEGYTVLAADLFGQGVRPETTEEKKAHTSALYGDRAEMRARMSAALEALKARDGVDPSRIVVMGYCFGGSAALELARSGADIAGVATFHGGLATPADQSYAQVKGPVLVMHGSADTSVPMSDVAALAAALDKDGIAHRMEIYGGAPHAFTVWNGSRYNAAADVASWRTFLDFLNDTVR
ncbi:dienelactone hydrolase family protein [Kaustia mangrovi]|uniref:Dienelactone hydrolase family protein n=1 Tax=Kaustia mangrovi TaxID=2593653 RepID=A0A7S8C113_9HYPH|nr:dienelactone hydrolase family protein [Kaustia mangrovi]QPC41420.1 dienelactone hydrolase family protein [Kaustia mangrovi]